MAYSLVEQYKLHHNYPAVLPCGTAGMTGEDRIGAGKAGTRLLLLGLPGKNLRVCMCVRKYVCVVC